jgi:transglutaminase-like putative cysteine protease
VRGFRVSLRRGGPFAWLRRPDRKPAISFNPYQSLTGTSDAGSTHARAEVFVSGAGWISLDPTNRSVGGFNLIPVGVARDIGHIMPVTGSFVGDADARLGMSVEVAVTSAGQAG